MSEIDCNTGEVLKAAANKPRIILLKGVLEQETFMSFLKGTRHRHVLVTGDMSFTEALDCGKLPIYDKPGIVPNFIKDLYGEDCQYLFFDRTKDFFIKALNHLCGEVAAPNLTKAESIQTRVVERYKQNCELAKKLCETIATFPVERPLSGSSSAAGTLTENLQSYESYIEQGDVLKYRLVFMVSSSRLSLLLRNISEDLQAENDYSVCQEAIHKVANAHLNHVGSHGSSQVPEIRRLKYEFAKSLVTKISYFALPEDATRTKAAWDEFKSNLSDEERKVVGQGRLQLIYHWVDAELQNLVKKSPHYLGDSRQQAFP